MSDAAAVRALAERLGYRLVKGQGKVVGRHDYGKYGLEDARTGHKAFGFGNRGVTARLEDVARFLADGGTQSFEASLKASKKRRQGY